MCTIISSCLPFSESYHLQVARVPVPGLTQLSAMFFPDPVVLFRSSSLECKPVSPPVYVFLLFTFSNALVNAYGFIFTKF